jgi:glycosyltransferase involved in cell wall biosynthesis
MDREMVDFYRSARRLRPELVFLVLTQSDRATIDAELRRADIAMSDYVITRVDASEVETYLAAADFGISFVRPSFSKISSSPTKVAEYLAAGVPVVTTVIGDLADLFADENIGVLLDEFSPAAYEAAARAVGRLAQNTTAREQCRRVARDQLSLQDVGIPRYHRLYRAVASHND